MEHRQPYAYNVFNKRITGIVALKPIIADLRAGVIFYGTRPASVPLLDIQVVTASSELNARGD